MGREWGRREGWGGAGTANWKQGSPCCGPGRHTAPKLSHPLTPPPTHTQMHPYTETLRHTCTAAEEGQDFLHGMLTVHHSHSEHSFTYFIPSGLHNDSTIPISQMKKLRHREVK